MYVVVSEYSNWIDGNYRDFKIVELTEDEINSMGLCCNMLDVFDDYNQALIYREELKRKEESFREEIKKCFEKA